MRERELPKNSLPDSVPTPEQPPLALVPEEITQEPIALFDYSEALALSGKEVRRRYQRLEVQTNRTQEIADKLGKRLIGQPKARLAVATQLAVVEEGLHDPKRPLAAIYELGPTGVGKTEMAHAITEYFFDDPYSDRLKILNMGEYQEAHTIRNITGAPPSYVGGSEHGAIPHKWLHKGKSVIVFDEFDKAHPDVARTLLSILDKGQIQARNGEKGMEDLNFTNAFILFTSNDGAFEMSRAQRGVGRLGFAKVEERQDTYDTVAEDALQEKFKHMPEFLGRLTDVVVFHGLEPEQYTDIFYKLVKERNEELQKQKEGNAPHFIPTPEFCEYVLGKIDKNAGARALKPALDKELFARAVDIMSATIAQHPVFVDFNQEEGVVFYTDEIQESPQKTEIDLRAA